MLKPIIASLWVFLLCLTHVYSYDIVVAKDGSGDVLTVQAAFDKAPLNNVKPYVIFVKKGTYKQKIRLLATKKNVSLVGEDKLTTVLTFDDWGDKTGVGGTDNSYSTLIEADDFYAENITFENTIDSRISAYTTGGQAVALMLKGDRTVIHNCILRGFQDTFYTKGTGRTYVHCTQIEGTTDFIFGAGIAVFDHCTIVSKKNSYITAAANVSVGNKFNYVFFNCKLTASEGTNSTYLGRPWKLYARVVYVNCEEGSHIAAAGWADWSSESHSATAYFAEYKCTGTGFKPSSRISWSHQLTDAEAAGYTIPKIFAANAAVPAYSADWLPSVAGADCNAVILDIAEQPVSTQQNAFYYVSSSQNSVHFFCNQALSSGVLVIFNIQGVRVLEQTVTMFPGENNLIVPLDRLSSGMYTYEILGGERLTRGKFMLQKD